MSKRSASLFFLTLLLTIALSLTGCSSKSAVTLEKGKINVIASFYPLYDFAQKIGGDRVNVINVVPAGVEPHDWSPKSRDISRMADADLFIYQGSGFEGWTEDFLKSLPAGSKLKQVRTSEGLDLMPANAAGGESAHSAGPSPSGAQAAQTAGPAASSAEPAAGAASSKAGVDPHTWLSPRLAKQMAAKIKDGLVQTDPAHKDEFEANFAKLSAQFDALDAKYKSELSAAPKKSIVVTHDAFSYLCRDYGLEQKAIMGLSPDAEPTAQQMKSINTFIKTNNVRYIFFEELVSDRLAKTLAKDAGIETLVLSPLEGLTKAEHDAGADYFSIMESNLQNLVKALQ